MNFDQAFASIFVNNKPFEPRPQVKELPKPEVVKSESSAIVATHNIAVR